jgi:hypothetical protein
LTLRITLESVGDSQAVLKLEGRFAASDLPVLESCLEQVGAVALLLDMRELRWLDPPAVARISELIEVGARIVATSPFVEKLIARGERESPLDGRLRSRGTDAPPR